MEFKFELTKKIKEFLKDCNINEIGIGYSDSQVIKIEKGSKIYYLKMAKEGLLTNEYSKLNWLENKIDKLVPHIVLYEVENNVEYLITESLKGEMVCSDFYLKNPSLGIPVVVEAFKKIYEIDITDCPYNVSLDYKLNLVKYNIDNKLIEIENVDKKVLDKYKTLEGIYKYLVDNRFEEELCFSHGDISLPNIYADNNHFSGFLDVGDCGIADKWFDIAIATRTIKFNYGDEYLKDFYDGIGVIPDYKKIDYYLLMMELYL